MRLLVVLSRVPYPLEKGDKLRAFNQLKFLSVKHEIILCCINDQPIHPDAIEKLNNYCKVIKIVNINKIDIVTSLFRAIFSDKPFQVAYFFHTSAQKTIDSLVEKYAPQRIYCQLVRVSEYVKKYSFIPKTLDYMDAFSEGMNRRSQVAPWYSKFIYKIESNRLRKYESEIFNSFEHKTIISHQDREFISHFNKQEIQIVENGIDMQYFNNNYSSLQKKYDLLFCGNMNYPPNIESAQFIVNEVLPLLKEKLPEIKILIAGANPHSSVKTLKSKNVVISGWMDDIRDAYKQSKIFFAPMQTGTGLQNKLLEAMAMKLPCITSVLANNALNANNNKEILIGTTPTEYATLIIELLSNSEQQKKLSESGYEFVKTKFNWITSSDKLDRIIIN